MKLLLNGEQLQRTMTAEATLAATLLAVQEEDLADEAVISEIWVDDEPLTAQRLAELRDQPISSFGEARIEAPSRKELAINGLRELSQQLAASADQREQLVEAICQGRSAEAMEKLGDYLNVWNGCQATIGSACRLLAIQLDQPTEGAQADQRVQPIMEQLGRLGQQLAELRSALQAGDLVLIGDILDYEFGDITDDWCTVLEQFADQIEQND